MIVSCRGQRRTPTLVDGGPFPERALLTLHAALQPEAEPDAQGITFAYANPLWHGPNSAHGRFAGGSRKRGTEFPFPVTPAVLLGHEQSDRETSLVELNCEAVSPYPLLCRCCDSGRCLPLP